VLFSLKTTVTLRAITVVSVRYTTNVNYSSDFVNASFVGVSPK